MHGRSSIGVVLLGLGVVGAGVARAMLERANHYSRRAGVPLTLRRVLVRDIAKPRGVELDRSLLTTDSGEALETECDVVVEVIGGEEPARDYIERSLRRGRTVVTANKEVISKHGPKLLSLATQHGADLLFEASVGGGIPIVSPLRRDLSANEIASVRAIINGTTNYILTRMSREGVDFGAALAQAQELGYAEADNSAVIEALRPNN